MWLETVILTEAMAVLWLSATNLALAGGIALEARGRARRIAALTLVLLSAAQAMEALLFLWLGPSSLPDGRTLIAVGAVRTAILVSAAVLALLLVRARVHRRRERRDDAV